MANPRNTVDFEGIAAPSDYLTFKIDNDTITYDADETNGSAQVGLAVKLTADDTVGLTTDASEVVGKLIKVEKDNKATVQVGGCMTLPSGSGASLTLGKKIVGDLDGSDKGYIREVATGTAAELGVARGMILNNDTASAVMVRL